jgi:hypothetical protein
MWGSPSMIWLIEGFWELELEQRGNQPGAWVLLVVNILEAQRE